MELIKKLKSNIILPNETKSIMILTIMIECSSDGPIPGYQVQHVANDEYINTIIQLYCSYKRKPRESNFYLMKENDNSIIYNLNSTVEQNKIEDGDKLLLVKIEDPNLIDGRRRFLRLPWNKWWTYAILAFAAAFLGLLITSLIFSLAGDKPDSYGIVFDAGSTHTEMIIYKWNGEKWDNTGVVQQIDVCQRESGIGEIYINNLMTIRDYLMPCIIKAKLVIPENEWTDTNIYLAATAGLRMLQMEDANGVKNILTNVSNVFKQSGFKYNRKNIKIIDGAEESISGWITVNFLSNKLFPVKYQHQLGEMFGALDLGGASTQITFETDKTNAGATVKIYGEEYNLYSKSFLCHGINQIAQRHKMYLTKDQSITELLQLKNPCFAEGVALSPAIKTLITPCSKLKNQTKFETVTYIGTSNGTQCLQEIRGILNKTTCENNFENPNCLLPVIPNRPPNTTFVGFSAFYYAAQAFNLTNKDKITDYLQNVLKVCDMTHAELINTNFPGLLKKYQEHICYLGLYVYVLINDYYKFNELEWSNTYFANSINHTNVGWTLGFMTESTNSIPAEEQLPGISVGWFVVLTLIFIACFAFSVWMAVNAIIYTRQRRRQDINSLSASVMYGTI